LAKEIAMTRLTLDPILSARLHELSETLELCDEAGRTLGYFHPIRVNEREGRSPFSDVELAERRKQRTGRPLSAILEDLNKP
jgi:hypothetical protein